MKERFLSFLLIITLLLINTNNVYASTLEKGNLEGTYYWDFIELPNNRKMEIDDNYIALFINGTLVTDYKAIVRDDKALVPIRLIIEELGGSIEWDGDKSMVNIERGQDMISLTIAEDKALVNDEEIVLDHPAILYDNLTYVPLRFIAEELNATVKYAPPLGNEYEYYYDTRMPISPADTIVREFPNIIIDEKYESKEVITKEEAMKKAKEVCLEGLKNFRDSIVEGLIDAGEDPKRLDGDFADIENQINRMIYIGEVSRYYKFTIGPYDILYDKYNDNIFFEKYSSGIIIKKVDIYDKDLYIDVFIVG